MGIEGGSSNREVQSQEIQQANSEQNELNQADHKRSGEELEANSTIDNEGERKQIEGREEATDSKDGNSSRLDDAEAIEDERQGSGIENEERSYSIQDNLDDLGTIEDDTESFDDPNEDEVELEDDSFEDAFITDEDEFIEDAQDDKYNDDNDGDFSDRIEDDNNITETEESPEIHEDYETIDDDEGTDDLEDSEEGTVEDEAETENSAEDVESDETVESAEDTDDVEDSKGETAEETVEAEDFSEEGEADEIAEGTEDTDDVEDSEEEVAEDIAETEDSAEDVEADETVEDAEDTDDVEDFEEKTVEDTAETEGSTEEESDETVEDTEDTDDVEDSEEESVENTAETEDSTEEGEADETVEDTEDADDVEDSEEETAEDNVETEDSTEEVESDEAVEDTEDADDVEDTEDETVEDTAETEDSAEDTETDETVEDTDGADDVEDTEDETVEDTEKTEESSEGVESDEAVEDTENTDSVEDSEAETTEDTTETEASSDASDSYDAEKRPEKLEDLSWKDIDELMKTPEGREVLNNMNADFRERYEADMRGMSVEEYRDYKAALARADYERKKENGEIAPRNPSDVERNANAALEAFNYQDDKSSRAYMSGARMQDLKDISDKNHEIIKELKGVRQDIEAEHDKVWDKIASMNYDGSRDYNPGEYEKLCEQYRNLESLGKQLDYAIVKTDMNNWDISQVTGVEYKDESKRLTEKEISSTFKDADSILKDGVTDNASIMDAYRVGEKLEHDVLPSLDGERRELESRLNVYENAQMNYRKEHFCTHEEAMKTSDGIYAQNERDIQKIKGEIEVVSGRMIDAVEKATALHDQVPVAESDCKLKVIDNKDGTITIERTWDNGGADKKSYEGRIHNAETIRYNNAKEKKDSITLGQNSGSVYSHSFSFQYRGLGFKREDTWGSGDRKLKSIAEGGFLNFNASFGYKRGIEGAKSTIKADAGLSLAQFKETASLVVKDKEYKGFAAEVSLLKGSSSISADSKGLVKASASAHIAGGEAAISAGGINIAKISGGIGEAKASLSTNLLGAGASASMGEYKSSVSVWSVLKNEDSAIESDDKQLIEAKGTASVGNGISLVSSKISSTDGEVKNTTVVDTLKKDISDFADGIKVGSVNINGDTVSGIVKDVKAIKDIKEGNLGTDISKKTEDIVIGNSKLREKPEDFESKIVDHSVPEKENHDNIDLGEDLKRSLEPFKQSKWNEMSFDERKEAVAQLADSVAKDLGLENQPDVKYYQSDKPGDFGGFSASENAIYINANNMDDAAETADTIAHESRHCWQHEYAESSDSSQAKDFKENFDHYRRPERNYEAYLNQPVEKDAREYASTITNEISTISSDNEPLVDTEESKADSFSDTNRERGAVFDASYKPENVEAKLKYSDVANEIASSDTPAKVYKDVLESNIYSDKRFSSEGMVREGLALYNSIPEGKRTDINPVNNSKAVRTDEASRQDGIEHGYLPLAWHDYYGLDESRPILGMFNADGSSNIPETVYRRGSAFGNNLTCAKEDGMIPTTNEISVPYEDNAEAMHEYKVDSYTYKSVIEIVAGVDEKNTSDLEKRVDAINDIIDNMNSEHGTSEKHIDSDFIIEQKEAYDMFQNSKDSNLCRESSWKTDTEFGVSGTVAPMYVDDDPTKEKLYDGGAAQFNTPMSINTFVRMGAMWEKKNE